MPARPCLLAALQASLDAKESTERVLQSLSSVDEDDASQYVQRNPSDPTRFFQQVSASRLLQAAAREW